MRKGIIIPQSLLFSQRVYSNVYGPLNVPTLAGSKYYVVFVEDCSRLPEVFMLIKWNDLKSVRLNYCKRHFNGSKLPILFLRTDNGGEYIGIETDLTEQGIVWERSSLYMQHANVVAEQMIRLLNTKARSFMLALNAPHQMWSKVISTAAYIYALILQRKLCDDRGVWK